MNNSLKYLRSEIDQTVLASLIYYYYSRIGYFI